MRYARSDGFYVLLFQAPGRKITGDFQCFCPGTLMTLIILPILFFGICASGCTSAISNKPVRHTAGAFLLYYIPPGSNSKLIHGYAVSIKVRLILGYNPARIRRILGENREYPVAREHLCSVLVQQLPRNPGWDICWFVMLQVYTYGWKIVTGLAILSFLSGQENHHPAKKSVSPKAILYPLYPLPPPRIL